VPASRAADSRRVRIVLDEDLPPALGDHLRARGYDCTTVLELKETIWPGATKVADDDVCREVARIPSVLVTLNVRDYADRAFIERLVQEHRVSVVIVRPPQREAGVGLRPQAIHDIVHRHAHRLGALYGGEPSIVSANRVGFRRRPLSEIP
jgi:hypothetical protein